MVPFHFFSLFLRPQTHATWTNLTRITWQKLACGRGPGVGEGSGHPSCFLPFHHQNHQILSLGLKPARECCLLVGRIEPVAALGFQGHQEVAWSPWELCQAL